MTCAKVYVVCVPSDYSSAETLTDGIRAHLLCRLQDGHVHLDTRLVVRTSLGSKASFEESIANLCSFKSLVLSVSHIVKIYNYKSLYSDIYDVV